MFLILCLNVIPEQYFRQDVYTLSIFVFVLCMIYGIFFIVLEFVPGLKEKITKQKHASSDLEAEMDMTDIDDEINSEFDSDFDLETTSENNNEE